MANNTCPHCGYQGLPEDASVCPSCNQPVAVAPRLDLDVRLRDNYGNVTGVRTNIIQGDVYGGDIYQVQVYALSEAGRADDSCFLEANAPPYKFLLPFGPRDQHLFKGRQADVLRLLRYLAAYRLLVLYGASGVGKTSLLAAGVIPELARFGAMVLHLRDYSQPLAVTLRAALKASREQLPLELPEVASLAELVAAITAATQGTLVLVLDQFEGLFQPAVSPEQRAEQINALIECLRAVDFQYLRLVLVVRDDALVRLHELQEALPDMFRMFMELSPLTRQQAKAAITEPLEQVARPIYFAENLVDDLLLPDLDGLTPETTDTINPTHLQIVCHWLYEAVIEDRPPLISAQRYLKDWLGAAGILANYLNKVLDTALADHKELAKSILVAMASPGVKEWMSPGELHLPEATLEVVQVVMQQLAENGLLVQREEGEASLFAFTSPAVVERVYQMSGGELEQKGKAYKEVERIWEGWLAHGSLASSAQLGRLTVHPPYPNPGSLQSLLLLRSAVACKSPVAPWLAGLHSKEGQSLIRKLEGLPAGQDDWHFSQTELHYASLMLGLEDETASALPNGDTAQPYGRLARSAVTHENAQCRQTAALALSVPDRFIALDRLDWALKKEHGKSGRWRRKAELRGALAEADPQVAQENASLSLGEQLGIWGWRVWRRLQIDWVHLGYLSLGAALGAGLALGVLRFLLALPTTLTPGLHGTQNFMYGALLGAALVFGILFADFLLLKPFGREAVPLRHPDRKTDLLRIGLGAFFFGLMNIFIAYTTGSLALSGKGWVLGLGFAAGLALSLALVLLAQVQIWAAPRRWPLAVLVSGALIALLQAVFLALGDIYRSIVFIWPAATYRAEFGGYANLAGLSTGASRWYWSMSIMDAALVGMLLALGLLIGLRLGERGYAAWRALQEVEG